MRKINTACIIDDDDIYTFTINRIITRAEIADKTLFFHNGRVAMDFLKQNVSLADQLPDLILLDLNMPVLDGWQFMDEYVTLMPAMDKKIEIFIVSSSIDEEDHKRARAMSAVSDFIIKPLNANDLRDIVKKLA